MLPLRPHPPRILRGDVLWPDLRLATAARERTAFEAEWREATQRRGNLVGERDRFAEGGYHFVTRIPIRPGYLTQSEGGRPVAPLLGDFQEYDGGITAFMSYPLNWFVACNDHAMLARFTPLGPQATEMEFTWLVRADAVAGVDYDPLTLSWLWRITAEQDKTICENNQKGVNSRRYQPGPYSAVEASTRDFITWYLAQLARVSSPEVCHEADQSRVARH
jgi:phenylpropionate dioxygenase-like ring-hydroxylating dioxygenase large terminal subunit